MNILRILAIGAAATALAACNETGPTGSTAAVPFTQHPNAVVTAFKFAADSSDGTEGSTGTLTVNPDGSARYQDVYCNGMENTAGRLDGTSVSFPRMTYKECNKPEPLWADISVDGYNKTTGCFAVINFTWGYNFVQRYQAYPTEARCQS